MSGFDYRKAMPTLWTGKTGRWLRGQPAYVGVVAFYVFTCPSSTQWGVFYLPVVLICNDTGRSREEVEGALKGLQGHGFLFFDPESEVIWVVNMCRDQVGILRGKDNRIKAAADAAVEIVKMPFGPQWYEAYRRDLQLPLMDLRSPFEAPSEPEAPSKPLRSQDQDQEQEQEQEPESDSRPLKLELAEPEVPARSPIRIEAERLWSMQEEMRARTIPHARPLKATEARIARVLERLAENSSAESEHVLRVYEADALHKPDSREWFNGETNWRKANFDRALGRAIPHRDSKPAKNATLPVDDGEAARLVRALERDAIRFGLVDAEGNPT